MENKLDQYRKKEDLQIKDIKRLTQSLETLNNPNVTKEQISDLLILNSDTVALHKQNKNYSKKVEATKSLLKNHMEDLKLKGVKVEN